MTQELLALIVAHIVCADTAQERYLSMHEVQYCNAIYQEIKLAFVPGVDAAAYVTMSTREQHAVNMEGYLAFHTWRIDNPSTIRHLERVARGEVALGRSG